MGILVEAIGKGYYNWGIRMPGDRFEIAAEEDFSRIWMKKVKPRRLSMDELVAQLDAEEAAAKAEAERDAADADDETSGDEPATDEGKSDE